ncbi:MAG: hypothetical protein HKO62_10610 [Gammaproteobacteria bacterium]|nr:hypothetical protein [Gammaproteobacteria bacterium]
MNLASDPRWLQLVSLTVLLVYGVALLDFSIGAAQMAWTMAGALLCQYLAGRLAGLPRFDPFSALISALSLCLLLRTDIPALAGIAAVVAIGSKFLLRAGGRHLFNPTAFAIVTLTLLTDHAWLSFGQWGPVALWGLGLAGLGMMVVTRARRADVTLAFLAAFGLILLGRAAWLGDPLTIPLHQLQNGALLLFAFFMISDPRTTPASRRGRIVFGLTVAAVAASIEFGLHQPGGPILALVLCAPLVPLSNLLLPDVTRAAPRSHPTLPLTV